MSTANTPSFAQAHADLVNALATYQDRADALAVTISVTDLVWSQVGTPTLHVNVTARIGAEQQLIRWNMGCYMNGNVFIKMHFLPQHVMMSDANIPLHHMEHFVNVNTLVMDVCKELAAAAGGAA
jgi:hypothetical protein